MRVLRSRPVQFLRIVIALALIGVLIWDLTGRSATKHIDGMPKWVWTDTPVITAVTLVALIFLILPKRNWRNWFRRAGEPSLVAQGRRYLLRARRPSRPRRRNLAERSPSSRRPSRGWSPSGHCRGPCRSS